MYRSIFRTALVAIAALALASQAHAGSVSVGQSDWTGSCNNYSGLNAGGYWGSTGCQVSWDITYNSHTKDYTYTWTVCGAYGGNLWGGNINHFIVGCGSNFGNGDVLPGTSGNTSCGNFNDSGHNNPGLPCGVYGLDFNFGGSKCTYTLVTDCAPVWGDCYSTDGNNNDCCNSCFNNDGGQGCQNPGNYNGWIPCPGNPGVSVPVPSSLWMGMATLGALAVAGIKRRIQRA